MADASEQRENMVVRTYSEEELELLIASQQRSKTRTNKQKVWGERTFRDAIADSDRHLRRSMQGSPRHFQQNKKKPLRRSSITNDNTTHHRRNTTTSSTRSKSQGKERKQQRDQAAIMTVSNSVQECLDALSMDPYNPQPNTYYKAITATAHDAQKQAEKVSSAMLKLGRELRHNKNLVWTLEKVLCGKRGMVSQIVQVMQSYDKNARVQVSALCLLCRIIHANRWLSFVVFKAGAVYPTLHAMRQFQQLSEVQLNGCALLLKLLDDILSDENDEEHHLLRNEILPVLILVFNQQSFSQNLHPHIPSFLQHQQQQHPAAHTSNSKDGINPIANAAKLLWRISATRQGRQYILNAGGAEAVCRAMIDVKVDMGYDVVAAAVNDDEERDAIVEYNNKNGTKSSTSRKKKQKRDLMTLHLRLLQDHAHVEDCSPRVGGSTPPSF